MYQTDSDECTENIYDSVCFSDPIDPETFENLKAGIELAIRLENRPAFAQGVADRLNDLGVECTVSDTDIMLSQIRERYKRILGKPCPRTVLEWIRGTTPGNTNRQNNYELCCALEMDFEQTEEFFRKHFFTQPFNPKSKIDAVFMYTLFHKKPYETAKKLLESSVGFVSQENAHTSTSRIASFIFEINDDEKFLQYLSSHCYGNEQQFQRAREVIISEIDLLKAGLDTSGPNKRLNSMTISELLGYRYQLIDKKSEKSRLPKRFTGSLPNDVTLGRIINGESASYELLRKTLMLLKFYNFYSEAQNTDPNIIGGNLMDLQEEIDLALDGCGFAPIYIKDPFDCLLFYCANSYDPILTMHLLNERN